MPKIVEDPKLIEELEKPRRAIGEGKVRRLIEEALAFATENPNNWIEVEGIKSAGYVRRILVKRGEKLYSRGGNWIVKKLEGKVYVKYVAE